MVSKLQWTNPINIDLAQPFIYRIVLVDGEEVEWRYVGKAAKQSRIDEYLKNLENIAHGRPRRELPNYRPPTPTDLSNQKYRAVHFGLAKSLELGWKYEFSPIESTSSELLSSREKFHIKELQCNLNGGKRWEIEQYAHLSLHTLAKQKKRRPI